MAYLMVYLMGNSMENFMGEGPREHTMVHGLLYFGIWVRPCDIPRDESSHGMPRVHYGPTHACLTHYPWILCCMVYGMARLMVYSMNKSMVEKTFYGVFYGIFCWMRPGTYHGTKARVVHPNVLHGCASWYVPRWTP